MPRPTIEALDRAIQAIPFRPFAFMMSDGRFIYIPHRDFIAFAPRGGTCVVMDEEGGLDVVDLLVSTLNFEGSRARMEGRC